MDKRNFYTAYRDYYRALLELSVVYSEAVRALRDDSPHPGVAWINIRLDQELALRGWYSTRVGIRPYLHLIRRENATMVHDKACVDRCLSTHGELLAPFLERVQKAESRRDGSDARMEQLRS